MTKRLPVSVVLPLVAVASFFVVSSHAGAVSRPGTGLPAMPASGTVRSLFASSASSVPPSGPKPVATVAATGRRQAARTVRVKTAALPDSPRRLSIPRLNIDAPVEDVGLLKVGRMDVPADGSRLGWYTGGVKPGAVGNAVIAGHLDTAKGPGAFWELNKTRVGDVIEVRDAKGTLQRFVVRKTALYDMRETQPVMEIFGPVKTNSLNLITCAGTWDRTMNHYDKRFVVYAEAVAADLKIARQ